MVAGYYCVVSVLMVLLLLLLFFVCLLLLLRTAKAARRDEKATSSGTTSRRGTKRARSHKAAHCSTAERIGPSEWVLSTKRILGLLIARHARLIIDAPLAFIAQSLVRIVDLGELFFGFFAWVDVRVILLRKLNHVVLILSAVRHELSRICHHGAHNEMPSRWLCHHFSIVT